MGVEVHSIGIVLTLLGQHICPVLFSYGAAMMHSLPTTAKGPVHGCKKLFS